MFQSSALAARDEYVFAYRGPFGSGLRNWSLHLFHHSTEPSFFFFLTLDRYETSLLMLRTSIHRKVENLWITIRIKALVHGRPTATINVKQIFLGMSENMQKYYTGHY